MENKLNFATFYRVLGVFLILLCHFTQESTSVYLNMSAQLFNIGVDMFFILSGFLFGIRSDLSKNIILWYKKRIKRIYIPYELFVIVLLIVHLICGKNILKSDWLWLILGLQGSVVGVLGAEQTWFITSILLCYLITPLLDSICIWIDTDRTHRLAFIIVLILIPIGLALLPFAFISTVFSPLCWYGISFFIGRKFDHIIFSRRYAITSFFVMCIAFGARLAARSWFDGTIFYDKLVVGYTQVIAAYAIFYMTAFITRDKVPGKVVSFIASVSFEIYLYHYMFCVGPVRLFSLTNNWVVNCIIVTVLTVCIAIIMNIASRKIIKKVSL